MLLLLGFLLVGAGCAHGPYKGRVDAPTPKDPGRLAVLNEGLVDKISVDDAAVFYTKQKRLRVELKIRNDTDRGRAIQVQTIFMDERGLDVDATAWRTVVFSAWESKDYEATTIKREARDYRVRMRRQQ